MKTSQTANSSFPKNSDNLHRFSIAPMMAYTDRHYRWLMRRFSQKALLTTEMVVANTLKYRSEPKFRDEILAFHPDEHPISIQLGGDDPQILASAAKLAEAYGYDEINLNVGCPSDRVKKGQFGACLMLEPEKVGRAMEAITKAVSLPVSVKTRLGVDEHDSEEFLHNFVTKVHGYGVHTFIIHARKAWLQGLSPAQNRSIPPLLYDRVYRLKQAFPHLTISINGGVQNLEDCIEHLKQVDGVMIGRAAYHNPEAFWFTDQDIFCDPIKDKPNYLKLLEETQAYLESEIIARDKKPSGLLKHLLGWFKGQPNARLWRQTLTKMIQDKPKHLDLPKIYWETVGKSQLEPLHEQK